MSGHDKELKTKVKLQGLAVNTGHLGWIKDIDAKSQLTFYWNIHSNECSWKMPLALKQHIKDEGLKKKVKLQPLAVNTGHFGWVKDIDAESQLPFYWNIYSKESSWNMPIALKQHIKDKENADNWTSMLDPDEECPSMIDPDEECTSMIDPDEDCESMIDPDEDFTCTVQYTITADPDEEDADIVGPSATYTHIVDPNANHMVSL